MISLPKENSDARLKKLLPFFTLKKPEGEGKFPIIIMLHGCGDPHLPQDDYKKAALENGFGYLSIDSLNPRGVRNIIAASTLVCSGTFLWGRERAGDFAIGIKYAKTLDWVDSNNIHAIGWSHGGWTIMDALALETEIYKYSKITDLGETPFESLKTAGIIYPWCGMGSFTQEKGWQRKVPSHMIIGGSDAVVGDKLLLKCYDKLLEQGVKIEKTIFEKAAHAYDQEESYHPLHKFRADYKEQTIKIMMDQIKANLG